MDTKGRIREHSEAKLSLYQEYLKAYIPIMLHNSNINHLWILDVYAGEGETDDHKEGSTVRLLKVFIDTLKLNTEKVRSENLTPFTFVANELDENRNNKLKKILEDI